MYYGLKHPDHNGEFVRSKGCWGKYHKWCLSNGYAKINKKGNFQFTLQPKKSTKTQGRNEACNCESGRKFKNCCMNV